MAEKNFDDFYITPCPDFTDEQIEAVLGPLRDKGGTVLITSTPKTSEGNMWMKELMEESDG